MDNHSGRSPNGKRGEKNNCMICGKPLVYLREETMMTCSICGRRRPANAMCEDGHFVCDECHAGGGAAILALLQQSGERDPMALLEQAFRMEDVHLHGPEHHGIVACVLLTAFHNCGGEVDLQRALPEAWNRGKKIPGGSCGFLGICGAAAGAGAFASIVSGSTPLTETLWEIPQRLVARCMARIAEIGGPRCCKRTTRLAVECAAAYAEETFGISMPVSRPACAYWTLNGECIRERCPYFPKRKAEEDA